MRSSHLEVRRQHLHVVSLLRGREDEPNRVLQAENEETRRDEQPLAQHVELLRVGHPAEAEVDVAEGVHVVVHEKVLKLDEREHRLRRVARNGDPVEVAPVADLVESDLLIDEDAVVPQHARGLARVDRQAPVVVEQRDLLLEQREVPLERGIVLRRVELVRTCTSWGCDRGFDETVSRALLLEPRCFCVTRAADCILGRRT
mmetsp:Transcript_13439/g.53954  ORF Transcript_13439/g.53954 Transcript_13439/m.53954 type:complete len:202 (+) Transcript_13439:200-805(+)